MTARYALHVLLRAALVLLLLTLLVAVSGFFWLDTQHGLNWLVRQTVVANEGRVVLEGVQGSLYDRITVSRVTYKDPALELEMRNIIFIWQPQALFSKEARVTELSIADVRIAPKPDPSKPLQLPAALQLPLKVRIGDVRVKHLEIEPGQIVQDLHFRLNSNAKVHALELINVSAMGARAEGNLQLDAKAPFAVVGNMALASKVGSEPIKASVIIGGTLEALQLQASTTAHGASAKATGLLRPFSKLLLDNFTLDADNVDLAAWDKTLPHTKGRIALVAGMPAPEQFAGTVRVENDIPGTIDTQRVPLAHAALSFSGSAPHWTFSNIEMGIGNSGRALGSGSLEGTKARLELLLANIRSTELHGKFKPLTISGRATVTGDANGQRFETMLESKGVRLELAARHAQQVITVERGSLRAEKARLDFTGRAALSAKRDFSVDAAFANLDPARFLNAPPARLNGKAFVKGVLAPEWQAQVSLAITNSSLRGQTLAANAEFISSVQQWFSGKAHALYGGNRIDLSGGFGKPGDKLQWSLDAANLKVIDSTLAGNVKAQGTLAGSLALPSVEFKVTARKFSAGEITSKTIDAQGVMLAGTEGDLRLTAKAGGVRMRGMLLDEFKMDAKGTRLRHELTAVVRGANIDASLSSAGGLDDKLRWSGNVTALEARGRFAFRLTAPARVSVGRGVLEIDGLQANALGGVMGPIAVRMADGGITSSGTLTGIAAKALLALLPETGIDARDAVLGGRWDFAFKKSATGTAEIKLEKGDLALRSDPKFLFGLRQLQLKITASDNNLDASIDVQSSRIGTLAARGRTRIERRDAAWALTSAAPLEGNLALDMQSLDWVRALVPQIDQIGGRVAARLKIAGTIGRPLLTGEASADAVQVRALGPGVDLNEGTLRATLDGRNVKIAKFYVKAGDGKIEADGDADFTDGLRSLKIAVRATRARILSSPQLNVVLSGTGSVGLSDLKLALDGKFKIDKGHYDLGSKRKPQLGDDVVIIGQTPAASSNAKPIRTLLDLTIDLNDSFTVRGHGLDAVLGGTLRTTTSGGTLNALGTIQTVKGEYFAYGQQLNLERGRLYFSGPLNNPGLDLRAGRKIKTVEVGVEVTGSLQRPVVKLASTPAMSDSDKLGWLVLGRDPQTANAAELAILQAAALSTGSRHAMPLQKQIAQGLGLDEFDISGSGSGAVGVLALGKRITEKLTVRLEQALGGTAGSVLKIDFLMSPRWRLEGTAGVENAADILFTLRFD